MIYAPNIKDKQSIRENMITLSPTSVACDDYAIASF